MKRIKAFTLFELVLGMLLAAIVIGMAYYASSIFMRIYDSYSKGSYAQSELVLFKKVVSKDVERAARLDVRNDELLLKDPQGETVLSYTFASEYALRRGAAVDTFKLDNLQVRSSFEGNVQESGLTDLLVFSFRYAGEPAVFTVRKQYSAKDLFELKR
ncbi:prepilin-type N-terminal cleavage/methylation domain-containing protein [Pedobacter africanus]|uniref:Prepilin-type N-terminal cleavage/methylation domain-containing protein n=1 Tax=Pedobacter africanus TaxID=151894 RepID=A0A1W2EFC0_9SPHI|nr:prepilin-type N-terminal cleavage/methylation domain-containing protein [Pedobacter africanus]SMD08464.1 hypothetical protein SAMN04488524_4768 [Pedobacter africanus]